MAKTRMISSRECDNKFTRVLNQSALEKYLSIIIPNTQNNGHEKCHENNVKKCSNTCSKELQQKEALQETRQLSFHLVFERPLHQISNPSASFSLQSEENWSIHTLKSKTKASYYQTPLINNLSSISFPKQHVRFSWPLPLLVCSRWILICRPSLQRCS